MALIPVTSGGSGQMVETILYVNNNSTDPYGADGADATLIRAVSEFDYIRVEYYNCTVSNIIKVSDLINTMTINDQPAIVTIASSLTVCRRFYLTDYYTVHFTPCRVIGGTGTANRSLIPEYIYGCKIE